MDGESGPLTAAFAPTSGLPALVDQVTGLPKHSVEHLLGQPALLREARSGQLSNHFADGEVVGDLYTPRYYEILKLTNDPIYASRGWLLLRREHQAQKDRLTAVHAELTGLKQFTSHPGHIVISDTSALVEGVWLQEFDWRAAVARGPAVRLVIPIWSSRNLTASKTATATTLAPVPARSFASCANCGGGVPPGKPAALPNRAGVTVEILLDGGWHRRRPVNDDEIIDQALRVKSITGQDVTLACVDASMEFRAQEHGLAVLAVPRPADTSTKQPESSGA